MTLTEKDKAAIESVLSKGNKAQIEPYRGDGVKVLEVTVRKVYEREGERDNSNKEKP